MPQMILIFRRTGQRRYAVEAKRDLFPDLEMNPAPGYDALMPHDLMHLVVEAQLGLKHGIFGQLEAGGDAGTFHLPFDPKVKTRTASRSRHRIKAKGKKLLREGRDESIQSERATFICWYEWRARSQSPLEQKAAQTMTKQATQVRDTATTGELRALSKKRIDQICEHLDELGARWSKLEVGQSIAVRWPDLAVSSDPAELRH
jgi:hypothetical protein